MQKEMSMVEAERSRAAAIATGGKTPCHQEINTTRKESAAGQTRTDDNLVNSQVLYLLSYGGRT